MLHQPRHVRVLTWLDPDPTNGLAMRKGREKLAEGEDICLMPMT